MIVYVHVLCIHVMDMCVCNAHLSTFNCRHTVISVLVNVPLKQCPLWDGNEGGNEGIDRWK